MADPTKQLPSDPAKRTGDEPARKSVNHGFPQPKPRDVKKPAIPRYLKSLLASGTLNPAPPSEEQCKKYGRVTMRCLKPCGIGYGVYVKVGDTFQIDGANGAMLANNFQAEFVDQTLKEEERVLAEMEKLGLNKPLKVQHLPEFQQPKPESESTWR